MLRCLYFLFSYSYLIVPRSPNHTAYDISWKHDMKMAITTDGMGLMPLTTTSVHSGAAGGSGWWAVYKDAGMEGYLFASGI